MVCSAAVGEFSRLLRQFPTPTDEFEADLSQGSFSSSSLIVVFPFSAFGNIWQTASCDGGGLEHGGDDNYMVAKPSVRSSVPPGATKGAPNPPEKDI